MGRDASTGEAEQPAGRADVVEQRMQLAGGDGRRCWGEGAELVAAPHMFASLLQAVFAKKGLALATAESLVAGVPRARSQCRCRVQTPIAVTGGSFK